MTTSLLLTTQCSFFPLLQNESLDAAPTTFTVCEKKIASVAKQMPKQ